MFRWTFLQGLVGLILRIDNPWSLPSSFRNIRLNTRCLLPDVPTADLFFLDHIQLGSNRNLLSPFTTFFSFIALHASISNSSMGFFSCIFHHRSQLSSSLFIMLSRFLVIKELVVEDFDEITTLVFNFISCWIIILSSLIFPVHCFLWCLGFFQCFSYCWFHGSLLESFFFFFLLVFLWISMIRFQRVPVAVDESCFIFFQNWILILDVFVLVQIFNIPIKSLLTSSQCFFLNSCHLVWRNLGFELSLDHLKGSPNLSGNDKIGLLDGQVLQRPSSIPFILRHQVRLRYYNTPALIIGRYYHNSLEVAQSLINELDILMSKINIQQRIRRHGHFFIPPFVIEILHLANQFWI